MKRKEFLKTACPAVAFGFFGVTKLQACYSTDGGCNGDNNYTGNDSNGNTNNNTNSGITVSGNNISIDLTNNAFAALRNTGGWMNILTQGVLVLRISENSVRAFDNCCPHQGTNIAWSYSNQSFKCASHGNQFSIDGTTASCDSGATSGALTSYQATLSGDLLTIVKS
jgi:Rieske Fe-S protein